MTRRSYTSSTTPQDERPPQEFELDGVVWVCENSVSVLDLSEYARLAQRGVDSGSPEGVAILADVYSGLLGSKYQAFRDHCRRHGTDDRVLVQIIGDLISDAAQRPTRRPSDSSDGPQNAPGTAKVVSFDKRTVEVKPLEETQPREETPQVVSYG